MPHTTPAAQNYPWQDGVQVLIENPKAGQTRKTPRTLPSGYQSRHEPDFYRAFCIVHLMFAIKGDLFLLVEELEGAHATRRKVAPWQSPIIPNWPRLQVQNKTVI